MSRNRFCNFGGNRGRFQGVRVRQVRMKQRHANTGGSLEFLQSLPAFWTFSEVSLQSLLFFLGKVARGRNGAQLEESVVWSHFRPTLGFPIIFSMFHDVGLPEHYSQTSASATYRGRGSNGSARFRGFVPTFG